MWPTPSIATHIANNILYKAFCEQHCFPTAHILCIRYIVLCWQNGSSIKLCSRHVSLACSSDWAIYAISINVIWLQTSIIWYVHARRTAAWNVYMYNCCHGGAYTPSQAWCRLSGKKTPVCQQGLGILFWSCRLVVCVSDGWLCSIFGRWCTLDTLSAKLWATLRKEVSTNIQQAKRSSKHSTAGIGTQY